VTTQKKQTVYTKRACKFEKKERIDEDVCWRGKGNMMAHC